MFSYYVIGLIVTVASERVNLLKIWMSYFSGLTRRRTFSQFL